MKDRVLYVVGLALTEAWVPIGVRPPIRLLTGKQIADEGWETEEKDVLGGKVIGLYKAGSEAHAAVEVQGECPCAVAGAYLASCAKEEK